MLDASQTPQKAKSKEQHQLGCVIAQADIRGVVGCGDQGGVCEACAFIINLKI